MTSVEYPLSALTSPTLQSTVDGVNFLQFERNFGNYTLNFPLCLSNSKDFKVNNYSNFYLTNNYLFSDIFPLLSERFKATNIITDIIIGNYYLNFSKIDITPYVLKGDIRDSKNYGVPIFTNTPSDIKFNIELLDDNKCRIYYKSSNNITYYLASDIDNKIIFINEFKLSFDEEYINPQDFTYLFSESSNKILFFKSTNIGNYTLIKNNSTLILVSNTSDYISNPFQISRNVYTTPDTLLNTSFITYNNNNTIDVDKSEFSLKNNYLLHRKYSDDSYLTDIIVLKNQLTPLDTFSNSNILLSGNTYTTFVDNFRNYTSIFQNIKKEASDELELNYSFANQTYKIFEGDNIIETPSNMYPFSKININDCKFIEAGAFPYYTPEYADKIYKLDENSTHLNNNQHLLCTWLYRNPDTKEISWVDRYYYPDLIEKEEAMQAYSMYIKSPLDSYIESIIDGNLGISSSITQTKFFDKRSDLAFSPNRKYKYQRISENSVTNIPNTICRTEDELTYPSNFFESINDTSKFTLSFYFEGDDTSWKVQSNRNEIPCGVTIIKNGELLSFEYIIFDPLYPDLQIDTFTTTASIKFLKTNFISISFDGYNGIGYVYLNTTLIYTFTVTPYKYINKNILYGDFYYYKNDDKPINITLYTPDGSDNIVLKNTYIPLDATAIYPILNGNTKVDALYLTLPSGTRNSTDNVESIQQICSNSTFKTNSINIVLKNLYNATPDMKNNIEQHMRNDASSFLPSTTIINTVTFENYK